MPSSDNSDGKTAFKSENGFEGNNKQSKMSDRASGSDRWSSLPEKKMWSKRAHLCSKDKYQKKSSSAIISDRWNQVVNQYWFEKNSLYNTITSLCTLVIGLPISLFYQLFELSGVLRMQLLLSPLIIHTYQLFIWLNEKAVKILVPMKQEIRALSISIRGKRKKRVSGTGAGRKAAQTIRLLQQQNSSG